MSTIPLGESVTDETSWVIQCRESGLVEDENGWQPWARATGELATKVALAEFRNASRFQWRAVRVHTTTRVLAIREDW